jgi:Spy/CpxP family protein refolding chaperone
MKKILTGMLSLLLIAGAANAQDSTHGKRKQHGDRQNHEMMANKLGLSDDQKTQLKSIHEAERKEMQSLKSSNLTQDQMKAKRAEIHQKYKAQSQAIFTPAQKAQMDQMKAGHHEKGKKFTEGKRGDSRGEALNLSAEQKASVAKLREEYRGRFETIRNDKSLTDAQRQEKTKALKLEQKEKMKSILTKEQAEKMKEVKKEGKHKEKAKSRK